MSQVLDYPRPNEYDCTADRKQTNRSQNRHNRYQSRGECVDSLTPENAAIRLSLGLLGANLRSMGHRPGALTVHVLQ